MAGLRHLGDLERFMTVIFGGLDAEKRRFLPVNLILFFAPIFDVDVPTVHLRSLA